MKQTRKQVLAVASLLVLVPIAIAIPIIRLACKAAINEIADILPRAIEDLEIGEVNALFINP